MKHWLLLLTLVLALTVSGAVAQSAAPCPATGIRTDPAGPLNPLRPDRRNTFNWWNPPTPGPSGNRFYPLYYLDSQTGQGRASTIFTPYQQPDNGLINFLSGTADLPANGWELLAYNLGYTEQGLPRAEGAPLPYVVLYHRFTGIMRVFVTQAQTDWQQAYTYHYITLRFASGQGLSSKTGLLNRVAAPATALLDAPAGAGAVLTGVGRHLNQPTKWFVADFPLDYDPCTCLFRSELEVEVSGINPRVPGQPTAVFDLPSVYATGPVSGLLLSPYGRENIQDTGPLAGFPVLGYQQQQPGALLTTGHSWFSLARQQRRTQAWLRATTADAALAASLDSAAAYWYDADRRTGSQGFLGSAFLRDPRTERLTNGLDFLSIGGLSTGLPVPGFVAAQQPSAYAQTGSRIQGYSRPTASLGTIRLATPGAAPAPDDSRYPYYNETLGVLSLLRRPTVQRQVEVVRDAAGRSRLRYRFRLPADLEYALNPAAGLEVTDFRAALVVAGNTYPAALPPGDFATYEAPLPLTDSLTGPVQHLLRTAYVPAGCLRDRVFTLEGPADCAGFLPAGPVSVKVWVELRRPDAPAAQPVLLLARYPAALVEADLGPATPAPAPCSRRLPPQPAAAVAALCASPAYQAAMRLDREAAAELAGLPAYAARATVQVYPNPAAAPVAARLELPAANCVRLRLFDAVGRLVATPLAPTPCPAGATTIPLAAVPHLAGGAYFLVLDANGRRLHTTQLLVNP